MSLLFRTFPRLHQTVQQFKTSQAFSILGKISTISKRNIVLGAELTNGLSRKNRKVIGFWLLGCAGLVYGAVALGGVTRLTESGLSMVNWDLFRTMKPPFGQKQWEEEFERYKAYPEYEYKSSAETMTLSQFKFIWSMEYLHRMLGRFVGVVFLLPCAYFWAKGRFSRPMKIRMLLAGSLLVAQGLIGWWMVKSGLNPTNNSNAEVPRVSEYRLATHLTMAFVLYTIYLWTGLSHVLPAHDHSKVFNISRLRSMTHTSKTLIVLTAIMGAFVAGLDAGWVYNSWPKFGDKWIPEDLLIAEPKWKNIFENPTGAQFVHRNMAYLTLLSITLTWLVGRRMNLGKRAKIALHLTMAMGYTQVMIGIYSLLYYVPVWLGALHQSGSMVLMTFAFWLSNEIRRIPK